MILYESEIERITLDLLRDENGHALAYDPDLFKGASPERSYHDVVLQDRLRATIDWINQATVVGNTDRVNIS